MARGPGFRESDAESCRIIGERQFLAAKEIYEGILGGKGEPVVGSIVKGVHTFVNFGQEGGYRFRDLKGVERRTCKAALGFSFAAGSKCRHVLLSLFNFLLTMAIIYLATDGPGALDFTQNEYAPLLLSSDYSY